MCEDNLLELYSDVRRSLDRIHNLVTAIEGDLARHQIYGEVEAISLAQRKVKELFGTAILMESYLCACTGASDLGQRQQPNSGAMTHNATQVNGLPPKQDMPSATACSSA